MIHIFQQGSDLSAPTFVMLHGKGGMETDLIPLAKKLNPDASILSVRGNVLENGRPNFFNRYNADENELVHRTKELNKFLDEAAEKYQFNRGNLLALGLTNGASLAANLLLSYGNMLKGAILYHPDLPNIENDLQKLDGVSVFIGASKNNDHCPMEDTMELERRLKSVHANVTLHLEYSSHYLTGELFAASRMWYESTFLK